MSTVAIASIAAAGIGAAGSIASGAEQAGAAKSAQQLQAQEAEQSLQFQEQEFNTEQANQAPFLKAGTGAISTLSQLTSTPGQGLLTPWTDTFEAPTAAQAEATPGYQFTLGQGEQALQNSAAASGGLLTGGTAKALTQYGEGLADTTYQQTYQNALQQYETAYSTFQNNQTNTYNRLAGVAGTGQTAAQQLGTEGQSAAQGVSNINLTTGAQQGQDILAGAAATASGYAGATNAVSGGLNSIAGALTLQQLLAQQNPNDISGLFAPGTPGTN
jgi:hypothetical protein